jgi:hypothetical protein
MSDQSTLLRQLLAAREQWVDVAPGKAVRFRRPLEGEMEAMFRTVDGRRSFRVGLDDVRRCAVDWRGFTEADLLGAAVGGSDPLPFDSEVFGAAIGDNLDWLQAAIEGLGEMIVTRMAARAEARGNSGATSTPPPAPKVATSSSTSPTP